MTTRTLRRPTARRIPSASNGVAFPAPVDRRLALVCAGGGVTGAVYEIGALAAIEDRMEGVSLTDFDVFVGISSGAYLSALLANGITPALLYRNVIRSTRSGTALDELALFRLNYAEIAARLAAAPMTILDAAWHFYRNRRETTLTDLVQSLGSLLPSGLLVNRGLEEWLAGWLKGHPERTDDFRKLRKQLRIVAVELETGEITAFGAKGHEDVPISRAVRASCAIPGLYKPVKIKGVEYIDGGVRKTANISLALRERCGLTLCINPIVPFHIPHPPLRNGQQGVLSRQGLASVLDQCFRVTLHSRMRYGLDRYRREAPGFDVLVFEPRTEEIPRFMSNIMRTSARQRIAEWAYQTTMEAIDADFARLSRVFAKHGIKLKEARPYPTQSMRFAHALSKDENEPVSRRLAASLDLLEQTLEEMPQGKRASR